MVRYVCAVKCMQAELVMLMLNATKDPEKEVIEFGTEVRPTGEDSPGEQEPVQKL